MPTLILKTIAQFLLPLLLLVSVFVMARGHNAPGGGFVGGLLAAAAFVLYALAFHARAARQILRIGSVPLLGVGLLMALSSGLPGLVEGRPFMTAPWISPVIPGLGAVHLGTPLLFDLGVYLIVLGAALTIILALEEP